MLFDFIVKANRTAFSLLVLVAGLSAISSCSKNEGIPQKNAADLGLEGKYTATADTVIKATFTALSTALQAAMKDGGVKNAVDYCKVQAIPLTDSMSVKMGAVITRVTNNPRNPANIASSFERQLLSDYTKIVRNSEGQTPLKSTYVDRETAGSPTIYKPIIIKGLCLNCHGSVGKELTEEHYAFIKDLYPNDKAISYEEGDVRGLWKVSFNN